MSNVYESDLRRAFKIVEDAALVGGRCPTTESLGQWFRRALGKLARDGDILIEVFALNWRVVTILTGPHAGKKTSMPPHRHGPPYMVIGKDGSLKGPPSRTNRVITLAGKPR